MNFLQKDTEPSVRCANAAVWWQQDVVADIEGGTRCQLTSSGLSACTIAMMAFLRAGEHCLIPDSVYGEWQWWQQQHYRRGGWT